MYLKIINACISVTTVTVVNLEKISSLFGKISLEYLALVAICREYRTVHEKTRLVHHAMITGATCRVGDGDRTRGPVMPKFIRIIGSLATYHREVFFSLSPLAEERVNLKKKIIPLKKKFSLRKISKKKIEYHEQASTPPLAPPPITIIENYYIQF